MPDPATPGGLLATCTLQNDSGFFRDAIVNTFHFQRNGGTGQAPKADKDWVSERVMSFYNDVHGAGANQIRWYLSSTLNNGTDASFVKVYDMSDPHPRQPEVYPFTLGASAGSDNGLPFEAALCISYSTAFLHTRRGRGRIYIGPLHSNTVLLEAPNVGVNAQAITALKNGARYLMDEGDAGVAPSSNWSIYSRADNQLRPVTLAYVDNEFDTQRRRQHRATQRTYA